MTHQRWTQKGKPFFPKKKYEFAEYLKNQGDQMVIVYGPVFDTKEYKKIRDAAYLWAFTYKKTVRCKSIRTPTGCGVRITLVREYRLIRELMDVNVKDLI